MSENNSNNFISNKEKYNNMLFAIILVSICILTIGVVCIIIYKKDISSDKNNINNTVFSLEFKIKYDKYDDVVYPSVEEKVYIDDKYNYYLSAETIATLKIVFENQSQYRIKDALSNSIVTIEQLEEKGIRFYKQEITDKIDIKISEICDNNPKLYYSGEKRKIYLYCLDEIYYNGLDIKNYYLTDKNIINKIMNDMVIFDYYNDGGSKIYENNKIKLLECNTLNGDKNIYITSKKNKLNYFCNN